MYTLGCFSTHRAERRPCFCLAVRSEHGIRYVKLPSASSTSSVLRFLENLCQYLESDSVFSSQPFSPFSSGGGSGSNTRFYNRTKSGGQDPPSRVINTLSFHVDVDLKSETGQFKQPVVLFFHCGLFPCNHLPQCFHSFI